ncbi:MAG: hypothetical protein Q9218_002559 [Villophora microphyllina]
MSADDAQRAQWKETWASNAAKITQELLKDIPNVQSCHDLLPLGTHNLPEHSHVAGELKNTLKLFMLLWHVGMIEEHFVIWMPCKEKPLLSKALALVAKLDIKEGHPLFTIVASTLEGIKGDIDTLASQIENEDQALDKTTQKIVLDVLLGLDTYLAMAIREFRSKSVEISTFNARHCDWMDRLRVEAQQMRPASREQ